LRDLLIELAASGLFRARWSADIHEEWIRNLIAARRDLTAARLQRTRDLMDRAVLDSVVEGFEGLIETLALPDPGDRHVLAAAIHCRADAIVTFNLKDFPQAALAEHGMAAIHPDVFLHQLFRSDRTAVVFAARKCRSRLKNPPRSAVDYLAALDRQSLPRIVAELRERLELI
jgi:hypothetical protein